MEPEYPTAMSTGKMSSLCAIDLCELSTRAADHSSKVTITLNDLWKEHTASRSYCKKSSLRKFHTIEKLVANFSDHECRVVVPSWQEDQHKL